MAGNTGWFPVYNNSGLIVPPFACMAPANAGVTDDGAIKITQPSTDGQTDVFFNGLSPIPIDGYGEGTIIFPAIAAYDQDADISSGDVLSPIKDSWYLGKGWSMGFRALTADDGIANIIPVVSGSPVDWVQVTSLTLSGGYYPGNVYDKDLNVGPAIVVQMVNGDIPTLNWFYLGKRSSDANGTPKYIVRAGGEFMTSTYCDDNNNLHDVYGNGPPP